MRGSLGIGQVVSFSVAACLALASCSGAGQAPSVVDGVAVAPGAGEAIRLDGTWLFYPEGAVEPMSIRVPSVWNGSQPGKASGVYKLAVEGLAPGEIYAFRFKGLNTVAAMYVDGKEIGRWGGPGMDAVPKTYHFCPRGERAVLTVMVSNVSQATGGIWMPVFIGRAAAVERAMFASRSQEAFVQSCILLMALYHILRFALRREEKSTALMAAFCLTTILKAGLSGEQLTAILVPWLAGELGLRAAYLTSIALPILFLLYLDAVFPSAWTRKVNVGLSSLGLPFLAICVAAPLDFMQNSFAVFQAAILLVGVYGIAFLAVKAARGEGDSALMLAGSLVLLASVLNDILYSRKIIYTFFSLGPGLLVFLLSQAAAISRSFARGYKQVSDMNAMLEKAVSERTAELETLTRIDPLTGLINRRHFWTVLEQEWNRWMRYGQDFCVVMVDIDHFKDLNDTFGHTAGDAALKAIASRISGGLRKTDTVARHGGEEFCLILPETGAKDAYALMEKVRQSIAQAPIVEYPEPVTKTFSYGVALASMHQDPASIIEAADKLMYKAKQTGRNRGYAEGVEPVGP